MYRKGENLVFFPDSPFADWIIDRCERLFPGLNEYYSFGEGSKNFSSVLVKRIGFEESELRSFAKKLGGYQRIIIHYHHELTGFLIEEGEIPSSKIIWALWSGDLYNSPFYKGQVYLPLTFGLESVIKLPRLTWKKKIREKAKSLLKKPGYYPYLNSFQRIQNVASFFPEDIENASKTFGKKYTHVFHGILSVQEQIKNIGQSEIPVLGNAVLLGHAGVPEINHLDVMDRFVTCFEGKKIICPLSYGNPDYIHKVKEEGVRIFSSRFIAMEEYMPRDEYFQSLSQSSYAVFGSLIHQGFGNIMTLLFLGLKVFMFEGNPIYRQLTSLGLLIFPLDRAIPEDFQQPLSKIQVLHNRAILEEILDEEKVDTYYRNVYQSNLENQ